jgi:hypothetical protein
MKEQLDICNVRDDYIDQDQADPANHGIAVFDIISSCAPKSSFSTYQVIDAQETEDGLKHGGNRGDVIQAINDAAGDGVDLLNLSIGIAHECNGLCSLSRETELAVNVDEVCAISATGNYEEGLDRPGVNCPALLDDVIGVGGYMPRCSADLARTADSGQWWLENGSLIGPFCGQEGCCPGNSCEDHRKEVLWDGNVSFHNAAPDVLAPVLDISGSSLSNIHFQAGTSFAAPMVTGFLAGILGDLLIQGIEPSVEEIRNAVRFTSEGIDVGDYHKFSAMGTRNYLS